jgi:endonuclease-3
MSTSNRADILTKSHKVLKKHYQPVNPPTDRPLLEHMLYACCLENSPHEAADEAFAKLQQIFFDWNEVRVTTVTELAEVMSILKDPREAASRLKRCLQSVFESHYSFEIDFLKKQNLGKTVKELERVKGMTSFVRDYVTQVGLGGHAIPANQGVLNALVALGVIDQTQADQHKVPGLTRAIPKSKGVEYGALIHQLGVDFFASPFSPRVRSIILEIDPGAKDRLPKRASKKAEAKQADAARGGRRKKKASAKAALTTRKAGKRPAKKTPAKKSTSKRIVRRKPK